MQHYFEYVCHKFAKERIVARFLENPALLDELRRRLEDEDIVPWDDEPTRRQSTDTSEGEAVP
jgi:hypothetical protein